MSLPSGDKDRVCTSLSKSADGCLQYYTGVSGQMSTFNYDSGNGLMLSDMDYTVCVRTERNFCGIQYTACADTVNTQPQSFTVSLTVFTFPLTLFLRWLDPPQVTWPRWGQTPARLTGWPSPAPPTQETLPHRTGTLWPVWTGSAGRYSTLWAPQAPPLSLSLATPSPSTCLCTQTVWRRVGTLRTQTTEDSVSTLCSNLALPPQDELASQILTHMLFSNSLLLPFHYVYIYSSLLAEYKLYIISPSSAYLLSVCEVCLMCF